MKLTIHTINRSIYHNRNVFIASRVDYRNSILYQAAAIHFHPP